MNMQEPTRPFIYLPLWQGLDQPQPIRLSVRAATPSSFQGAVMRVVRVFDPALTIDFRILADEVAMSSNRERVLAWLSGVFAALGLLIAAVGLYGVFSYIVARRRRELGIRIAVGAGRQDVSNLVLRDASGVLGLGFLVGLLAIWASGRLLRSYIVNIPGADVTMLSLAVGILAAVSLLASYLPARQAARVDASTLLHSE